MSPEQKPELAEKQLSFEQKFNNVQQKLVNYLRLSVPKEEAAIFKNIVLSFEKKASMTAFEVDNKINKLIQQPYNLNERSCVLQIIIYGWLIKKLKTQGESNLKQKLLNRYLNLINTQNSQDSGLRQVLNKYKLSGAALKKDTFVPGDPLMESPAYIPLDKSFYTGRNPNDIMPLGDKSALFIPEEFKELIKNADTLQIVLIKIIGKEVYNPTVKWYNKQNRSVKVLLSPNLTLFKKLIIKLIESFSAKKIAAMLRGVNSINEKYNKISNLYSGTLDNFYNNLKKSAGVFSPQLLTFVEPKLTRSKESTGGFFKTLLTVSGSVLDIAARDAHAMKRERANKMPKPDCYVQNKLFLMTCMQHKNVSGMQKYFIEFIAMTISNFRNDNELRRYVKSLEPSIRYLVFNTPMGKQITQNLPFTKTWEKMTPAEKEEVFKTFYDMLTGSVLTVKEKNSTRYKALSAMNEILISSIAKVVETRPEDNGKANLLLTASLLMRNIMTHLVSASGNKEKADQMIDKLVGIVKILKTRLSAADRKKIAESNPTLIVFLDNPEIIKISLKSAVETGANSPPLLAAFKTNMERKLKVISRYPLDDANNVKQTISGLESVYISLEAQKKSLESKIKGNILKGPLLENAKNTLAGIRIKLLNLQGQIRIKALLLKQLHERGAMLTNLTKLLKSTKNPAVLKSLISLVTAIETDKLPENLRKRLSSGILNEIVSLTDKQNYLYITNLFTDNLIRFGDNLFLRIPGSDTAFKLLVLNTVKTNAKFAEFRQNPARFLSREINRNNLKALIIGSFLDSIRHSANYRFFIKRGPKSPYQMLSSRIDSILSVRVA